MQELQKIEIKTDEVSIQETINNFLKIVEEVPWGNSDWQNQHVIVDGEITPERAYRHASLRIMNRLQALNECYYNLKKDNLQIRKLKLEISQLNPFQNEADQIEKELKELEIDKLLANRPYTQKLVRDAVIEVESLAPVIQTIGKLTKEQFDAGEAKHFEIRYKNQLLKNELIVNLENMGVDMQTGEVKKEFTPLFDKITKVKELTE